MTKETKTFWTTTEVAKGLGLNGRTVRYHADKLGLGQMVGGIKLFSREDIKIMRQRRTTPGPIPAAVARA